MTLAPIAAFGFRTSLMRSAQNAVDDWMSLLPNPYPPVRHHTPAPPIERIRQTLPNLSSDGCLGRVSALVSGSSLDLSSSGWKNLPSGPQARQSRRQSSAGPQLGQ